MDSDAIYMRDINRYGLLSAEEEIALAKRMAAGDERAREEMIQANLRLAVKVSRRYMGRGLALSDLIAEANIGLIRAVEKFDISHGCRFSTYAMWWIRQSVERAIMNQAQTIRVPVHVAKACNTMRGVIATLRAELGRDPTNAEIADAMGVSVSRVQKLSTAYQITDSTDDVMQNQGENSLYEITEDENALQPDEPIEKQHRSRLIQAWMQRLDAKERRVMRLRFGVDSHEEPWTLDAIGKEMGVTRERIRQIQVSALKKLRKLAQEKDIRFDEVV